MPVAWPWHLRPTKKEQLAVGTSAAVVDDWYGVGPSLRWIVCHMIEEYARHNGHADLLRESVDGLTGE